MGEGKRKEAEERAFPEVAGGAWERDEKEERAQRRVLVLNPGVGETGGDT